MRCEAAGTQESTDQRGIADQLPGKPQEGLLEVIIGLGGDVVVLEVLLAVEGDGLGLHLTLLNIDLVTAKDNRNVLADTDKITYVFVSDVLLKGHENSYGASWERSCR
jgi:hypothetical protein